MASMFVNSLELANLVLIILGGSIALSVLRRFRGGRMTAPIIWLMAAGGVFAIHELIDFLFDWVWPQPWVDAAYSLSETAFIVVLIVGTYKLRQVIPRGA